jgi:hypothetical protein
MCKGYALSTEEDGEEVILVHFKVPSHHMPGTNDENQEKPPATQLDMSQYMYHLGADLFRK